MNKIYTASWGFYVLTKRFFAVSSPQSQETVKNGGNFALVISLILFTQNDLRCSILQMEYICFSCMSEGNSQMKNTEVTIK